MSNLEKELEALRAENAKLKAQSAAKLKFKRSDKSEVITLSGLRRFPVSFYEKEWAIIFTLKDSYEQWLSVNQITDAERARLKAVADSIAANPSKTVPFAGMRRAIG